MAKTKKEPFSEQDLHTSWDYLTKTEHKLKRNVIICRCVQPVGAVRL